MFYVDWELGGRGQKKPKGIGLQMLIRHRKINCLFPVTVR